MQGQVWFEKVVVCDMPGQPARGVGSEPYSVSDHLGQIPVAALMYVVADMLAVY